MVSMASCPSTGSQGQVQGGHYSWAIAWSQTPISLPNGALAPDVAVTGLQLVPGAWCSLVPTSPSLPGKEESIVAGFPSTKM